LQTPEPDTPLLESGRGLDQVRQTPAQPVEPPDHQGVALADVLERLRQPGPVIFRSTQLAGEDLALVAACCQKRVALQVEVLVPGGDAGVADVHKVTPSLIPVLHAQPIDPSELAGIAGHEGRVVGQRRSRDQDVERPDG